MKTKILLIIIIVMFSVNTYAGGHYHPNYNQHSRPSNYYNHHRYNNYNYHRHSRNYRYGDYGYNDCHEYTNDLLTVFGIGAGVGAILGSVVGGNPNNNCNNCNNSNVRVYDPEYNGRTNCYKTVRRVWENGEMHEIVTETCNGHKVVPGY